MTDVQHALDALDRLEEQARGTTRSDPETPTPETADRTLADWLQAAQSQWFTIPTGRPQS